MPNEAPSATPREPELTGANYSVELLFEEDYDLAAPSLLAALRAQCPRADVKTGRGSIAIFHKDVPIQLKDASIGAQTVVLATDVSIAPGEFAPPLQQTRDWDEAGDVVARAKRRLLVTDLMAASLPPLKRLEVFQHGLAAVVKSLGPSAIVWVAAGKLVDPARFLAAMASPDPWDRVFRALNVRMFNAGEHAGECVMDTMGLASLGVPDLQIHFRGLDPDGVARHLFNTALYVVEKGDVLADGHTLDGIAPGQKWHCQRIACLVGPRRVVVDFDPGPPFAAGTRHEARGETRPED